MNRPLTPIIGAALLATSCAVPYRTPLAPAAFADAGSVRVDTIAAGVTHTFVQDPRGPWAFHVVEIDAARCNPVLEARKPGTTVAARATTTELASNTLVTINADFFALPGGTPTNVHVSAGKAIIGPTDRQVFASTERGWQIGFARMRGVVAARADTAPLVQLNRAATPFSYYSGTRHGVTLFTSWIGDSVPADTTARRITVRLLSDGDSETGGRGVIVAIDSPAPMTRLQPGQVALHVHGSAHTWARVRTRGDTLTWRTNVTLNGARVIEGVGGFPELLRGGRNVLGEQTVNASFGPQRHPRTAVGWTADRRLLFVVVDGRQAPYSDGMSLQELTWLFQRLGATDALNLDGGGSTAMVIGGRRVNRVSDAAGERAVGNGLSLVRCGG